jgi:two-component system OmpR family response regulator
VKAVLKRAQKKEMSEAPALSFNNSLLTIDGQTYQVTKGGLPIKLTPTEIKILFILASSPQKIFTREALVESALGYQFEGYERSIDAHIKHIRQKIGDDSKNPTFIRTIYGVGYKFTGKLDA